MKRVARVAQSSKGDRMSKVKSGSVWAWLVLIGCIGFYSIPTGIIANTSGIFVAPVMDQFGWSQTDTTMYRTIQPIVSAICAPFAGKLLEKYDPRWIMTAVSAVFGLASVASAFATELWQWNLYGVVFGVTAAFFMYLAAPVLINIWFEKGAGIAVSISAATLSLLAAIASPVGQALISAYGWQTARLVLSLVTTIASVVLCAAFVRKSPSVMNVLPFGASQAEENAEERSAEEAAAAVAAAENEGATIEEARKSPAMYTLILVAGIFCMCAAFFQQIPAFCAHGELGASVGAMAVSIIMVGGIVGKLLLGALNDKIGIQWTGLIATIGGALGITLAWQSGANEAVFYAGMAIFGFGYAGLTVIAPMLTRGTFGPRNYSQIYSWVSTGIFIATAISFTVYGLIYDNTGSYDGCFMVVIALYVVAAVLVPFTLKAGNKLWKK